MLEAARLPWQDTTTAIGTAGAALVAAFGFIATIWITRTDRRRGDEQRHDDRTRDDLLRRQDKESSEWREVTAKLEAATRIADERRHAADEATRRFHLETLLKAVEAYGDMLVNTSVGNLAQIARGRAVTYLLALPPDIGVCMRWGLGMKLTTDGDRKLGEICSERGAPMTRPSPLDDVYAETERDVERLLGTSTAR